MTLKWGYTRAFVRCALLFIVGTTLQMAVGDLNNSFLHYPWGIILAVNYLYFLVVIHVQADKWRWLRQLSDKYACISSLAAMVVMTVILGLTRQDPEVQGVAGALGFSRMTSSWQFNLLLIYFMTTLGLTVVDDLHHFRKRRLAAVMTHLGVFVLLWTGVFGGGDTARIKITLPLGEPVTAGLDATGKQVDLPFAVVLREFSMDEYPPKIYLLDTEEESSSRDFLSVENVGDRITIGGWRISVEQNLDMAGRMPDQEDYRPMKHVGAAPAVYVKAENIASGEKYEGWVSCGSHIFEPSYLRLGDRYAVAMPRREAKRYLSQIVVNDDKGKQREFDVEVNHPARVGSWRIYQVGYDVAEGRWSTYSVLECVRDPWYVAANFALWLLLASGVVMFLTAGHGKVGRVKDAGDDKSIKKSLTESAVGKGRRS